LPKGLVAGSHPAGITETNRPGTWVVALSAVAACRGEPTHVPRPRPALVVPTTPAELRPIVVSKLGFAPGERFVFQVRARGFAIGTGQLTVGDGEIRSTFETSALAAAFARVRDELVTKLDGIRPVDSVETLEADGKIRQLTTTYTGTDSHSVHTALGVLRAWAALGAQAGYIHVAIPEHVLRVELGEPSGGKGWLRVDGKIIGLDTPASFTCWLDTARVITRIEVRLNGEQVSADLLR